VRTDGPGKVAGNIKPVHIANGCISVALLWWRPSGRSQQAIALKKRRLLVFTAL